MHIMEYSNTSAKNLQLYAAKWMNIPTQSCTKEARYKRAQNM